MGYGAEHGANARLIAAAPDLLAALEAIVRALDEMAGPGRDAGRAAVYWNDSEAEAAREAIRKAVSAPPPAAGADIRARGKTVVEGGAP